MGFGPVPAGELVCCCYWEYARESARIRAAYDSGGSPFFPEPELTGREGAKAPPWRSGVGLNLAQAEFIDEIEKELCRSLKVAGVRLVSSPSHLTFLGCRCRLKSARKSSNGWPRIRRISRP